MKSYSVTLDIWKMAVACFSYIALAITAWVFLRLLNACFWLPSFLCETQKQGLQQEQSKENSEEDSKTK